MKRLSRLLRLPASDKRLLAKSWLLLWCIRLGLWLLPFQFLCDALAKMKRPISASEKLEEATAQNIVHSVKSMSRYVPVGTCLTQALTTQALLAQIGHPTDLKIGVAKSIEGKLEAHAWLESRGEIVIGKLKDLSRFTILSSLKKAIL